MCRPNQQIQFPLVRTDQRRSGGKKQLTSQKKIYSPIILASVNLERSIRFEVTVKPTKMLLTMTPSQVTAPVQLEALSVTVRGAYGQPVAGKKVRSAGAAPSQSLRFVQLLALRSARSGHRE